MAKIDVKENIGTVLKTLMTEAKVKNVNALPRLRSVSVNIGLGQNRGNKDMVTYITEALGKITGQKPVITKAKKAIAGFKLRSGDDVGLRVTLRGNKMYDFVDRLINVSLPRIRDFKGINPNSFDKNGCLTIGFKDQIAFVELGHDGIDRPFGVAITFSIKNSDPTVSARFLKELGFPMKVS